MSTPTSTSLYDDRVELACSKRHGSTSEATPPKRNASSSKRAGMDPNQRSRRWVGHRRQTGRPTTDRCTCKQRAIPRFFSDHAWRFHPTFDTHFFTRIYFDNDPNENLTPPLPSPTSAHTTRRCTGGAASSATAQRVDVAKTTKRPVEATRPLSSGERGSFRAKRSGVRLCGSGTWAGRAEVVGMGAGRGTKWALKACLQPP